MFVGYELHIEDRDVSERGEGKSSERDKKKFDVSHRIEKMTPPPLSRWRRSCAETALHYLRWLIRFEQNNLSRM